MKNIKIKFNNKKNINGKKNFKFFYLNKIKALKKTSNKLYI